MDGSLGEKPEVCVYLFRDLFRLHILYRGTKKMLQDHFLLLRRWIFKTIFFFSNRSLHRFHPLDHRRAEAIRTSFENVPRKYSGKVGEDSQSRSWQDEEGLYETIQGVGVNILCCRLNFVSIVIVVGTKITRERRPTLGTLSLVVGDLGSYSAVLLLVWGQALTVQLGRPQTVSLWSAVFKWQSLDCNNPISS